MIRRAMGLALALLLICSAVPGGADGVFEDAAFRGVFTTENLDAIIEAYELYDGWYWTARANEPQTYHGQEDHPGWTDTAVNLWSKTGYEKDWYGCRWNTEKINPAFPNGDGYGECFGFAQFIGYLLSGDRSPSANWTPFYSVKAAGGLKVGDLLRMEYRKNGKAYYHSAIVYSVEGDTVLFLQVSGGNFNRLRVRQGYTDGNLVNETSLLVLRQMPGIKIMRSPLNK